MLRNPGGFGRRLARWRGGSVDFDLAPYDAPLAAIAAREPAFSVLSDDALRAEARRLRAAARAGGPLSDLREDTYALVREAARRALGVRAYDVQVLAALALDGPHVVEMQTGEGKTLTAVMPAVLHALTGRGVHVLTFNDYLARRDAEWMGAVYRALGLEVGWVQGGLAAEERRAAYACDVTYVTAKEAGFDHLRDLLALRPDDVVHRPFHVAIVDEADSLLVDEARVPLVIAGQAPGRPSNARALAELVATLQPVTDFDTDEYGRNVELTEAGIVRVEQALGASLHAGSDHELLSEVHCALHARVLLRRDADYIVRDGRIGVVDDLTGRVVADRSWPDGLQAALEAKEGLARRPDGDILGSLTLEHFLAGYRRLSGMTGTAQAAAAELRELYGLRVVVVPTHRPCIRVDRPDLVFTHRAAKEDALVEEIRRVHASGRPLLVGTLTVEESERLGARLRAGGVGCAILNARNDAAEAAIVAQAGAPGAVTIATNMAGRGTDIRLGGPDESRRGEVVALGGLYVIGTNRHESERVDLQLRGRAGRQGDPGDSRFFVSLEDPLLVQFGIDSLLAGRFEAGDSTEPITHLVVIAEVARAQRIVDQQNFEIRRTLARYSQVLEDQRVALMERRRALLEEREQPDIWQTNPERYAALVGEVRESKVREAERLVTLWCIDRAWCDHLAYAADVREGIHLTALGGQDPLTRFTTDLTTRFRQIDEQIDTAVLEALDTISVTEGEIELPDAVLKGPSSTWTYLVNDDPFRNQIGMMLTGPGKATFGIGAALMAMPLLIFWGVVDRWFRRRPGRRGIR
jgi:preprotein translocase subunit SecA